MATSSCTPPPPAQRSLSTSFNSDLLISITPWKTGTAPGLRDTPRSTSPSKRTTRSSRSSLASVDQGSGSLETTAVVATPSSCVKYRVDLLGAATPSCRQPNLSTPLVPSNLLRSALKKSSLHSERASTPLQPRDANSPAETPIRTDTAAFSSTTADLLSSAAATPSRSPTKSLRFDQDVEEREVRKAQNRQKSKRASVNHQADEGDGEEEWVSEDDSEPEADSPARFEVPRTLAAPSTPIPALPLHLLPQTPSAFAFSPATPQVRTHESYDDDELTDCDADFSVYEEDSSFAFTNVTRQHFSQAALAIPEEEEDSTESEPQPEPELPDEAPAQSEKTMENAQMVFEDEEIVEDSMEAVSSDAIAEEEEATDCDRRDVSGLQHSIPSRMEVEQSTACSDLVGRTSLDEVEPEVIPSELIGTTEREDETNMAAQLVPEKPCATSTAEPRQPGSPVNSESVLTSRLDTSPDGACDPPSPFLRRTSPSAERSAPTSPKSSPVPALGESVPVTAVTPERVDSLAFPTPTTPAVARSATTPEKSTLPTHLFRPTQPPVHAAPTAKRQLTKLTSLASKRTQDNSQITKRNPALRPADIALTSTTLEKRRVLASSKSSTLVKGPSASSGILRPTASSSRLPPPSSARARGPSDPASNTLGAVTGKQAAPPLSRASKLSSSLPANTSMKPLTSTIPRPRAIPARSGLKQPSSATAPRTIPTSSMTSRSAPSVATKPSLPLSTVDASRAVTPAPSRPLPPAVRSARPELPEASSAPRQLPSLQQTSSAPSILTSSRGPSPPLPPARANHLPPVPRSARPANQSRPAAPSDLTSSARAGSPQKTNATPSVSQQLPGRAARDGLDSSESSDAPMPLQANPTPALLAPLPSSPLALGTSLPFEPCSPRADRLRSPRKPAPCSPLRSPRRVPVSEPVPPAFPSTTSSSASAPSLATSALAMPAARLVAASSSAPSDVFGSAAPQAVPARPSRIRSARPVEENAPNMAASVPVKRITRRTAAATSSIPTSDQPAALPPLSAKPAVPLVPRSARRPARPTTEPETEVTGESIVEPQADSPLPLPLPVALPSAPLFLFNPAPALTQEELSRLTQRNTKKNQQLYNKLKIETVFLDENRPPSPTSKIRKSFEVADAAAAEAAATASREASRESREARAAKRRRALRSSTDGSELETLQLELGQGDARDGAERVEDSPKVEAAPLVHFRAAGDDEQFCSPARPAKKSGGKKKSNSTSPAADAAVDVKKQVKWDKALVYEGPRDDALPDAASGILKHIALDIWGNATEMSTALAKPCPVLIRKRIFKDDEP